MPADFRDRFETTDGSRPEATPLDLEKSANYPLSAFAILDGGDVFEVGRTSSTTESTAQAYVHERITVLAHGATPQQCARLQRDLARQLSGNANLVGRMSLARPIQIDLTPAGQTFVSLGFPWSAAEQVSGFFWDHPLWPQARIALRQERLDEDPTLVFHEFAHAIHYLGFTTPERQKIYHLLETAFMSRAAMDEAFAIYSERELGGAFREQEKRAPGVYGLARRQWSEDHVFTRFVRKLYFPHRPAAGPGMKPIQDGDWMRKIRR